MMVMKGILLEGRGSSMLGLGFFCCWMNRNRNMYEKGTLCLREILNIDGINISKFDFTISSHEALRYDATNLLSMSMYILKFSKLIRLESISN